MRRTYKYRLYPTVEQEKHLLLCCGVSRVVWNYARHFIDVHFRMFKKFPSYSEIKRSFRRAINGGAKVPRSKHDRYKWCKEGVSDSIDDTMIDLQRSFKARKVNKQNGKKASWPKYIGRTNHPVERNNRRRCNTPSFPFHGWDISRLGEPGKKRRRVSIPKVGNVRAIIHREPVGKAKAVVVKKDSLGWFICISCHDETFTPKQTPSNACGIDLGVARLATMYSERCSRQEETAGGAAGVEGSRLRDSEKREGSVVDCNVSVFDRLPDSHDRKRRAMDRAISRKKFKSNRWRKSKHLRLKAIGRQTRRNNDYLHRITKQIAGSHGLIAIEDLNVKGMTASAKGTIEEPGSNVSQKSGLNRNILSQKWYEFRRQLEYKTEVNAGTVVAVPAAYTSQMCSECRYVSKDNRKSQAIFCCGKCGHSENADDNAAKNILKKGREIVSEKQVKT